MKYTKEQLHGMSDLEVNRALALSMNKYSGDVGEWMPNGVKVNDDSGFYYSECDYCNNWNDVMPLAVEHVKLMQKYESGKWYVEMPVSPPLHISFTAPNLQRAIACCLILVLQDKQ